MKIAILSVSDKGRELGNALEEKLKDDPTVIKVNHYHKNVKDNIFKAFDRHDAVIGIMATGILIRSMQPFIQSKIRDPAVISIDDNGNFTISLLSGHLGGANSLTIKISNLINSTPVITTSTDTNGKLGIDVLSKDIHYEILNTENIVHINKAILNGEKITFTVNPSMNVEFLDDYLKNNTLEMVISTEYSDSIPINQIRVSHEGHDLYLEKRKIVIGIGCRKGKSENEIMTSISTVLNELDLDISLVDCIASAEIKKDEKGLLDLAATLQIPIEFVDVEKLKLFTSPDISKSEFVRSKFGIDNVCESSALIVAGFDSKLIYRKKAFNGVTIAVAESERFKK